MIAFLLFKCHCSDTQGFAVLQEENSTEPPQSVQRGVAELVEAALRPKSLCMMDPTWHPWF